MASCSPTHYERWQCQLPKIQHQCLVSKNVCIFSRGRVGRFNKNPPLHNSVFSIRNLWNTVLPNMLWSGHTNPHTIWDITIIPCLMWLMVLLCVLCSGAVHNLEALVSFVPTFFIWCYDHGCLHCIFETFKFKGLFNYYLHQKECLKYFYIASCLEQFDLYSYCGLLVYIIVWGVPTLWRNTASIFMGRENKIGKVVVFVEEVWD